MTKIFLRGEPGDFQNYVDALNACGAEAVISMDLSQAEACDALLVPGGADVNPALYGQENTASFGIDDDKDRDEITLIRRFVELDRPVLGICRGHQIINVALGGDMIQHVPNAERHMRTPENLDNIHLVRACHPFLEELYGKEFPVNSAHHQAVDRLGSGLSPLQWSPDNIIEALGHHTLPVWGVQWHPERMEPAVRQKLFRWFLSLEL